MRVFEYSVHRSYLEEMEKHCGNQGLCNQNSILENISFTAEFRIYCKQHIAQNKYDLYRHMHQSKTKE